jgi:betaine-aldehyde dehydrogenase
MPAACWIDGGWVESRGPVRALRDPATGEVHTTLRDATAGDVDAAVRAASDAFADDWGEATPQERATILLRLADLVEAHADELTALEVTDTGKPVTVVRDGELPFAADNLRFFAGAARSLAGTGTGTFTRGYTSLLTRRPLGVVGAIAPWNFPLVMAVWKAGPALAAGCALVLKPAPATPRTTLRFAELAAEAGLPDGVLNVVTGDVATGTAIVQHPAIAMVSLTGSTETGRVVMARAAPTLKKLKLELGGKAPVVAFDDADVERLAAGATLGATYNTGQDCTAATRVLVERSRHDEVVEALRTAMGAVRAGPPVDERTDIGPLISREHRDRVHRYVREARECGARVIHGGDIPDGAGSYYPPTLITDVSRDAPIATEEVFGPVLVVLPVEDEEDAIRAANDVRYGLAASIWTSDARRALRVAHRLDTGVVWVNDHLPLASEAPHVGLKASGFGSELSEEAMLAHTVTRHVMIKHSEPQPVTGFRPA